MRQLIFVLVLLGACKVKEERRSPPSAPPAGSVVGAAFIPGHVIVKTRPGAALAPEVLARRGLVKEKDLSLGATLYRIAALDAAAPDALTRTLATVDELKKDPNVEYAEPDQVMTIQ
jgi:hypothetical protein